MKLQLSLTRGVVDGTALLEQLLDVISKELDQMSTSTANVPRLELFHATYFSVWNDILFLMSVDIAFRSDSTRDEKCGLLTSTQNSMVELAALVFCRVHILRNLICSVFSNLISITPLSNYVYWAVSLKHDMSLLFFC